MNYLVYGKGVKMWFNGRVYQNPDLAAMEEGQRLAKAFEDVKIYKITGKKVELLYRAETEKEICQKRMKNCFCPLPRRQEQAYA